MSFVFRCVQRDLVRYFCYRNFIEKVPGIYIPGTFSIKSGNMKVGTQGEIGGNMHKYRQVVVLLSGKIENKSSLCYNFNRSP